jgi:hypothetical protein
MQRIDTSTKATDLFGSGKHGFRDGDPVAGTPATRLNAAWFNALQEEVANVVEGAGIALDPSSRTQLLAAIGALIAAAGSAYVQRAGDTLTGQLSGPGGTYGASPGRGSFNGKGNGNAFIWGHSNSEYVNAIGALSGGGGPFISFWCSHGEGANEMVRSSGTIAPCRLIISASGDVLLQTAAGGTAGSVIAHGDWTTVGALVPASNAEVQAGTDTVRAVTPAGLASLTATATRRGLVELATSTEAQTGTDTDRAVTPAGLASLTATDARRGLVELATNAEVQAGTDTVRAVTPAGLASFARSLSGSGYQRLPGGLILQWGQTGATIGANAQVVVPLPVAFPAAALQAVSTAVTSSTNGQVSINVSIYDATSITLHNSGAQAAFGRYFIIGY